MMQQDDNSKPLPDLELYLVTHSLAICLALAKYSEQLKNGGDFLTRDIVDLVNDIRWPSKSQYLVDRDLFGQGVLLHKNHLKTRFNWSKTRDISKNHEDVVLGTRHYEPFFGSTLCLPCLTLADETTEIDVTIDATIIKDINSKRDQMLCDLGFSVDGAFSFDEEFLTAFNESVVRKSSSSNVSVNAATSLRMQSGTSGNSGDVGESPLTTLTAKLKGEYDTLCAAMLKRSSNWKQLLEDIMEGKDTEIADGKTACPKDALKNLISTCIEREAEAFPTWFHVMTELALGSHLRTQMNAKMNKGVPMEAMHTGHEVKAEMFHNDLASDPTNERAAARVNVIERVVLMMLHILIHFQRKGHLPVEFIYVISDFMKNGGLAGSYINLLSKLGLSVSNPTITSNLRPESLHAYCLKLQETIQRQGRDEDSVMLLMIDNYAYTKYQAEQKKASEMTTTVDTETILVQSLKKHSKFNRRPDRKKAGLPKFGREEIDNAVNAVNSRKPLDLKGVLDDVKDAHHCHLSDFNVIPSVNVKSSSHVCAIQLLRMLLIYLFGDKAAIDQSREVIQCTDPEFTLEAAKFAVAVPGVLANVVHAPAPFHQQKHGAESCQRQVAMMLLLLLPFYQHLKCKPSLNDTLATKILGLVTDDERDAVEKGTAVVVDGKQKKEPLVILEDEEAQEESDRAASDEHEAEERFLERAEEGAAGSVDVDNISPPSPGGRLLPASECSANEDDAAEVESEIIAAIDLQIKDPTRYLQPLLSMKTLLTAAVIMEREQELRVCKENHFSGPNKDKKLEVPARLSKALTLQQNLAKTFVINHERLKFLLELLYAVVMYAEAHNLVSYNTPLQNLLKMYLHDMIGISVEPFNKLNGDGELKPFYETLPKLTTLISLGGKPKIVRANLFLIAQLQHLIDHRPDVVEFAGLHCTCINEVFIEHQNSLQQREASERNAITFQDIRDASVRVTKKRNDLKLIRALLDIDTDDGVLKNRIRVKRKEYSEKPDPGQSKMQKSHSGGPVCRDPEFKEGDNTPAPQASETQEAVVVKPESEPQAQITRMQGDGKLVPYVKWIAETWFVPFMEAQGAVMVSEHVRKAFDGYRPMETEATMMLMHAEKFLEYTQKVEKSEKKTGTIPNSAAPASPLLLTEFSNAIYSRKNTKVVLWQIVLALALNRPAFLPPGWIANCKSADNLAKYVACLESAFVTNNRTPAAALADLKTYAASLEPRIEIHDVAFSTNKPVPVVATITINDALKNLDERFPPGQERERTIAKLLGDLDWDSNYKFPF